MIKIFKTKEAWYLVDDHMSLSPIVYCDTRDLLNDIRYLVEGYNLSQESEVYNGEENEEQS